MGALVYCIPYWVEKPTHSKVYFCMSEGFQRQLTQGVEQRKPSGAGAQREQKEEEEEAC